MGALWWRMRMGLREMEGEADSNPFLLTFCAIF